MAVPKKKKSLCLNRKHKNNFIVKKLSKKNNNFLSSIKLFNINKKLKSFTNS